MSEPVSSRSAAILVIVRSIVAFAVAASLLTLAPRAFGSHALRVHVRWSAEITPQGRQYLERRLRLVDGREVGERTFRYLLTDSSTAGVRALVTHPAATDTHYIDRAAFAPTPGQALYEWVPGRFGRAGLVFGPVAIGLSWLLAVFGAASAAVAVVLAARPSAAEALPGVLRVPLLTPLTALRIAAGAIAGFLQRGIPVASADAAGAFRIVFGACALAIAARHQVDFSELDASAARALAGFAWLERALQPWLIGAGMLFIAGVATRISYAAFTAGVLTWATVTTISGGSHATVSLAMALLVLLPSRWGDGLSVDAWLRRRPTPAPGRIYGFSIWAPGFMLGVAFAAAAWSKVKGGVWIANGTVKYHLMTDANDAYVDWGVRLTRDNETVAILASATVVVVEAMLITAAFSRSRAYRALLATAAAMLFAGFALFQGVVWPAWWVLFLSFLPWDRFRPATAGDAARAVVVPTLVRASALQLAFILAVVLQQVYVSGVSMERPPLFSSYDMYSASYDNMEQYLDNLRRSGKLAD